MVQSNQLYHNDNCTCSNYNTYGTISWCQAAQTVANHAERPEKFSGLDFKRWQQKMLFYLTTLNLARFLTESPPAITDGDVQSISALEAWKHSEYLCRNYVLNGLVDALYNVHCKITTAKELWESLDKKYRTEDAGTKKFVVARFLDYKMVDTNTVLNQVQELQIILNDIHSEGMTLSETFQVAAMIEKLPPSWVDFKNNLKHKRKKMTVEDLVVRLRIEEDNGMALKITQQQFPPKANMVEHGQSSGGYKKKIDNYKGKGKGKGKVVDLGPKKCGVRKQVFQFKGKCYNCGEHGHRADKCKAPKQDRAHMMEDDMPLVAMVSDITTMMEEINLVSNDPKGWWVDTGATRHVFPDRALFNTFKEVVGDSKLYMGNAGTTDVKGEGSVILKWTSGKELTLSNVLYVPDIRKSLVSGWLLNKHGFRLVFESDKFVLTKRGMFVGKGYAQNGMFKLNVIAKVENMNENASTSAYLIESSNVWHDRLGHVNFNSMRRLIKLDCIPKFSIDSKYKCTTCVEAKQTRSSFKSSKDEAIDKFVLYKTEVENQLNKKIKVLRSDRGGEYVSPFADICAQNGIIHECTAPYSPQQNGIAKRKNRTLKKMMNAMLISSGMSQDMWGEAILSATYLLNKIPFKKKDVTPYELWMRRKPSYKYLKVWGCLAKVVVPPPKVQRIGPKTVDCVFIGYAHHSSAYRFLVYDSKNPEIHKNTIMESRNASFFEEVFPCLKKELPSSSMPVDEIVHDEDQEQLEAEEVEPRRSKRQRIEKSFGPDFLTYMVEGEPQTYRDAVTSSEGPQWKEAIKNEIDSILQNHTWELLDLPPGCKPLGYRWIFKRKMKADGSIDKYKARLVIKGFRQKEGVDYFDTYSPVTRITSIRLVLGIAALRNLEVHQMDVKTAFLNGDLEEEIYMEQPEGFSALGQEGKVCKLVKSLYGLKQAPKQWHQKFDQTIFIMGSDDKMIKSTKDMLKARFDMKDMGLADVILGIKINRTQHGLVLSQSHYVDKILEKFNEGDTSVAQTPVDTTQHISKNRGEGVAQLEYSKIISSLMYLMTCTRPDLAYAIPNPQAVMCSPLVEQL
ncbi:hypothetical protein E3N88_40490 [Mikania micrantha]|uniref:Integrase catalytic domain-containing protein n=1 Tax=Mikania micrantha TaxID=192012 RepID=A0A5N6LMS3_9ASTR|nr:hypothetical protein E3N88_40490 [Mikania micrantha]